jgi:ribosome-associated protein
VTTTAEQRLVRRAVAAARDKKALDLVVLDVRGISGVADYFVLCSGRSTPHVQTITDAIRDALRGDGARLLHGEGVPESGWVLLDYGAVLVHVFLEETRAYYALERLWGDAPLVSIER